MSLAPGTRIGPYEIVGMVGAGGMGEVYRARDPKLQRDVALKILPEVFASDPDRLARFEREARTLAALNHPNIAQIYGLERGEASTGAALAAVRALVMELVEGPTLADRMAAGPIPIEEALPIATQIADALEAAHERGIIHRDLKPANIKVRPDGTVKVLDFGLAKPLSGNDSAAEGSTAATITSPALTRLGVILGTAAYMSPEQARGKEATKRSDIWAFGCVVYEMFSGRRTFEGSEVSDTLASILKSEPDWNSLPASAPPGIRRVLGRCLEKDPRRRFHDIADVRLELEDASAPEASTTMPAGRPRSRARERVAWTLVALLIALLAGLGAYLALKPPPPVAVTRFQVDPPRDAVFGSPTRLVGRTRNVVVSPNGTRLAFVATGRDRKSRLWIRAFDSFEAVPLAGTDGAVFPFWSPDSRQVGFLVGKSLMRTNVSGGSPQPICNVVGELVRGAAWGSDGTILFSSGNPPRLYRVSEQGGAAAPLPVLTGHGVPANPSLPHILPDGRTFLYWELSATEGPTVFVASMTSTDAAKRLISTESAAVYDPSGFLLFTRRGVLLRQRFDMNRMAVIGDARVVTEGVDPTAFSVSNNGVLAYQPLPGEASQFVWVDRGGQPLETVGPPGSYRSPHLSPDGGRLVYENLADGNLWLLDMSRRVPSKFTTGPGVKLSPVWSSDGRTIFYGKRPETGGLAAIYQSSVLGTADEALFFKGPTSNGPGHISKDGKWLLYFANPEGEALGDVYALPMTGDRAPQRIVKSPFTEVEPQFSPDVKFVAYVSTETENSEVYVQPFPPTGEKWRISTTGGRQPLWRPDGKELFFVSPESNKFYAVEIKAGARFDWGEPTFLFEMRTNLLFVRNSYIPGRDGQRFLINMALDPTNPPIRVVRNWTADLKD